MFHIVCTPPSLLGEGGLNLQPNFQKGGGLTGPQLLKGGCWERGGDFFQGEGVQFSHKKINVKYFMTKKYFSLS